MFSERFQSSSPKMKCKSGLDKRGVTFGFDL
jgi:hypothetical protein